MLGWQGCGLVVEEDMPEGGEGGRGHAAAPVSAPLTQIAVRTLRTPIGLLEIAASVSQVVYVAFGETRCEERPIDRWLRTHVLSERETPALRQALAEMREYFAGRRRAFDVAVDAVGTDFQQQVWRAIMAIPFGKTTSYQAIAETVGEPEALRAVGAAVGANPLPIIIPCHRVIGADGALVGYGGGLPAKVWLLRHEGALLA
jgi:O-6-methylguanine DNA methyltransferase